MTEQHQENQPEKNHSDVPMQIDQDQQLDSEAKLPADFRPAESSKAVEWDAAMQSCNEYQNYGDSEEALYDAEKAYKIAHGAFPENDPRIARSAARCGMLHQCLKEFSAAKTLLMEAYNFYQRYAPNYQEGWESVCQMLSDGSIQEGDLKSATSFKEKQLELLQQISPSFDARRANCRLSLSHFYHELGRLDDSWEQLNILRTELGKCTDQATLGSLHHEVLSSAEKFLKAKDHDKAEHLLNISKDLCDRRINCQHWYLVDSYQMMADLLIMRGEYPTALVNYERACLVAEEQDLASQLSFRVRQNYANACLNAGEIEKAVAIVERDIELLKHKIKKGDRFSSVIDNYGVDLVERRILLSEAYLRLGGLENQEKAQQLLKAVNEDIVETKLNRVLDRLLEFPLEQYQGEKFAGDVWCLLRHLGGQHFCYYLTVNAHLALSQGKVGEAVILSQRAIDFHGEFKLEDSLDGIKRAKKFSELLTFRANTLVLEGKEDQAEQLRIEAERISSL